MSRTAEWNAIQELLPYKPNLAEKKEQAYLICFFSGLLGWQVQSLKAMTESELQQARAKWQTYLGISEPIAPTALVETPIQDESESFLMQRRLSALHTWQANHQPGEWGRKKLGQILGRELIGFAPNFQTLTVEELEKIEHWMLHGELLPREGEVEPEPAEEEAQADGASLSPVPA